MNPKNVSHFPQKVLRISRLGQMSKQHHQPAILLIVAAHRPPPPAPPQGQWGLDLSTKRMGQTRRSGRWVHRYINMEIQKSNLEKH